MNNSSTTASSVLGNLLPASAASARSASAKSAPETASFTETLADIRQDVDRAKARSSAKRDDAYNRSAQATDPVNKAQGLAKRQAEHARQQESRLQDARANDARANELRANDLGANKKTSKSAEQQSTRADAVPAKPVAQTGTRKDALSAADNEMVTDELAADQTAPLLVSEENVAVTAIAESPAPDSSVVAPLSGLAASLKLAVTNPALTGSTAEEATGEAGVGVQAEKLGKASATLAEGVLTSAKGDFASASGAKDPFAKLLANAELQSQTTLTEDETKLDARTAASQTAPALEAIARVADSLPTAARGFVVQTGVAPSLGHPQWSQAVGDRVLWLASQNITSAELRLDPPELGPMQVRVSIHQDQVQVNFTSPHAAVREALDQGAARLREMFNEQGLNLNVNVSDQSAHRREGGDGSSGRGQRGEVDSAEESVIAETAVANLRLVDSYA